MKKILLGSIILTVFAASILLVEMSSCKKAMASTTIYDTIKVIVTDTLCPTPPTKVQILTQKTWRVAQLHHVINGVYSSYTLGGTNTTGINYDTLRFTFNTDGTGTTTDQFGKIYPLTWQFTTTDQRTMQVSTNGTTDTWQQVQIEGNYMNLSVQLTINGSSNNLETSQLVQVQ